LADPDVFEQVGQLVYDLDLPISPAPGIRQRMFIALENREKYSDKVITGVIAFFQRSTRVYSKRFRQQDRERLKGALRQLSPKEPNPALHAAYQQVLHKMTEQEAR
jgi:hypothetical protein